MLFDPDGRLAWVNAAALQAHGVAEAAQLGATADAYMAKFSLRYRNNHAATGAHHPLARLLDGEAFDGVVVEVLPLNGSEPVAVLELRGLVLLDDGDAADSMVLIAENVTEQVSAEERFERTFSTNPAPAVIARLRDLRYVKVNQGFQEMTGYTEAQVLDSSVYEIDLLELAPDREKAVRHLRARESIPQMEIQLRVADGGTKLVIVAGQPLDMADGEPCMLFTFNDLHQRFQTEQALRQSEERFARAFRLAPVPTCLLDADGLRFIEVNEAFVAMTGHAAQAVIGQTPAAVALWADAASRAGIEAALCDPAGCRARDVRVAACGGEVFDCLLSSEPVQIGLRNCRLVVLQDITERKRNEMELMAAIEAVMQDTSWLSRTIVEKIADLRRGMTPGPSPARMSDLTNREAEVLGLICQGLKDADIARRLGLKANTVRNHVASLYAKIEVHSRSEAIIWGRERGITGTEAQARRPKG